MTARVALLLLLAPGAALAQQVELVVLEESSRAPVAGAIVRLLGESGPVAQGLTIESGRIVLRAPAPGTYRIRVDRIGWSGTLTPPFPLGPGQTLRREILMVAKRTELPALEVQGKSRCARQGQGGPLAAALWDEVGKALLSNVITIRQGGLRLHVRGFLREVDLQRRPLREWVHVAALMRGQPFATLTPALLADVGFVQEEAQDSVLYAAPDAALLLSDEFVATHCFRAVSGDGGLVGLAFEPTAERRVSDVRGTLWVDRLSSELRFLEYDYTGLPRALSRAGLGGKVDFRRLPSGGWIVSYWHIRTPRTAMEVRRNGQLSPQSLSGYLDIGGRADIAAVGLTMVDRAVVIGQVYDSLLGSGLAGAVVRVSGAPDSAVTDRDGRFTLSVPVSGDQRVVVSHPRERLLNRGGSRTHLLSLGDTTRAEFAVAPLTSYVSTLCGNSGKNRSGILGMAWGSDGEPATGHRVVIQWSTAAGAGVKREIRDVGRGGLFGFCELPPDLTLPVHLMDGRRTRAEERLRLEVGEYRWVELRAAVP